MKKVLHVLIAGAVFPISTGSFAIAKQSSPQPVESVQQTTSENVLENVLENLGDKVAGYGWRCHPTYGCR
jgi:hypothetical protein